MCSTMDDLHEYCPVIQEKTAILTQGASRPDRYIEHFHYHSILFWGDQLTIAWIQHAQRLIPKMN